MSLHKIYKNKIVKGSVIGFTLLSLLLPGVFTACARGEEGMQDYIDRNNLNVSTDELADWVNRCLEYPDVLMLSGIEGEEGVVLDETVKINEFEDILMLKDGVKVVIEDGIVYEKEPSMTGKVRLPSRSGYIQNLLRTIEKDTAIEAGSKGHIKIAIEREWLPNDYTEAMWANPISRGEAMYILTKALNIPAEKVWNYEYKDVVGDKYENEINSALMNGYIQGFSTGNFKPDSALSVKEMNIIIENIGKSYEQRTADWKFAPDGRKIRETNLPENAADFEYILADTSNEYYEGSGLITKETGAYIDLFTKEDRVGMIKPKDLTKELSDIPQFRVSKDDENYKAVMAEWHPYQSTIYSKPENFDMVINRYKAYFEHCTNVDYRTIDDEWALELYLILYPHLDEANYYATLPKDGQRTVLQQYVDYVKEHKIILKSNRIQVEKSAVYHMNNYMVVRAYVDFDVVNFEDLGSSKLYLLTAGNTMGDIPLDKVVKGTYSGYVNNVLRFNYEHGTKDTDFIFAPTKESGVGRAIMLNTFRITSDVG